MRIALQLDEVIGDHVTDDPAVDHHVIAMHVALDRAAVAQYQQRLGTRLAADVALHVAVHAQAVAEQEVARDPHVVCDEGGELGLLDARVFFLAEHKYLLEMNMFVA